MSVKTDTNLTLSKLLNDLPFRKLPHNICYSLGDIWQDEGRISEQNVEEAEFLNESG